MPLLSFLLSHYLLTSQIILHQGEFVVIEEPENENVFLNLVFLTILPQESCHCVLRSDIIGGWVKYEGEVVSVRWLTYSSHPKLSWRSDRSRL